MHGHGPRAEPDARCAKIGAPMAIIRCPHCGTEHDTRADRAEGADRVAKCKKCDFVFVTQEIVARIIRQESPETGEPSPDGLEHDEPRTAISSGVATPVPVPADAGSRALTLTATAGRDAGKVWRETKPLLFIGRRNADVILDDQEASRQHAVIELHGDRFLLKDLGSTNGTYLDDARVSVAEIKHGSQIRIGDTVLVAAIESEG